MASLAQQRGVEVNETRLELRAVTERVLEFKLACKVRAMIVSATLHVVGRAEIGNDLAARFTELAVEGDGMIAGIAKTALEPRLAELRGKVYPIADLKLPGLAVRDVNVSADEKVRLTVRVEAAVS